VLLALSAARKTNVRGDKRTNKVSTLLSSFPDIPRTAGNRNNGTYRRRFLKTYTFGEIVVSIALAKVISSP
jgi:hypothetical protein